MRRVTAGILGFAVASLISALILSATTRLFEPFDIVSRIGMVPVFYYFSSMVAVLLGLPAFLLFLRLRLIRWWSVLGAGLTIGALMGVIVGRPNGVRAPEVLFMAATGAASALGFWLVWKQSSDKTDGAQLKGGI